MSTKPIKKAGKFVVDNWAPITAAIMAIIAIAAAVPWKYRDQSKKALDKAPKVIDDIAKHTNQIDKL